MRGRVYSALLIILSFILFSCNPPDDEVVYDYSLTDINNLSVTYENNIGPGYFENQVTVHYFGHQNWGICTARVGQLNALYTNLKSDGIDNVKIIAIGKEQYSNDNLSWTEGNSIPVVVDLSPNILWTTWGATQWDVFFLDSSGEYITDFNIEYWDYNKVYNQIMGMLPE